MCIISIPIFFFHFRSFDQIVYSISFLYYKLFGFLITAVVGLLFSLATGIIEDFISVLPNL